MEPMQNVEANEVQILLEPNEVQDGWVKQSLKKLRDECDFLCFSINVWHRTRSNYLFFGSFYLCFSYLYKKFEKCYKSPNFQWIEAFAQSVLVLWLFFSSESQIRPCAHFTAYFTATLCSVLPFIFTIFSVYYTRNDDYKIVLRFLMNS